MIFPIGDDQVKGGSKPMFAYAFIGINVLIFIFQAMMGPTQLYFIYFHVFARRMDASYRQHVVPMGICR